jgi:hypothetical protein
MMVSMTSTFLRKVIYLDDGEAEHGCGDVANPHTSKHGDEHVDQQNGPWLRSSLAKDKGSHHLGDIVL